MKFIKSALKVVPHICIIISGVLLIFNYINTQNNSLNLMQTNFSAVLILLLCLASITCSILLIFYQRKNNR